MMSSVQICLQSFPCDHCPSPFRTVRTDLPPPDGPVSIGQWHQVSWLALSRPPVLSAHHKSRTPELRSFGSLLSSPADRPAGRTGAPASLLSDRSMRKTTHAENTIPVIVFRVTSGAVLHGGGFFV